MVKVNNKKRILSDKVNTKKEFGKKKIINPFEIHINKQKYEILGQKLKNDRGIPGISRTKALKKRKQTLLQEYNLHNKSNKFVDKRIGERNTSMTVEDRQMARFTAERLKSHNKKSIYNLADEEVLTHRGQTLSEIEKFDDPRSDDDEDDLDGKNAGKLDDNFVKDAHFGGGILKKGGPDGAKSHKDLIDQLIAESKKRKAEKQKVREQTIELTEKLDTEWKDLLPLVNKSRRTDMDIIENKKVDPYDKAMRELKFEARGQPSDRLKSEDEIAKEEREKLEKLEQDRLNRMKGIVEENVPKNKHRSADDLDDNFAYESEPEITLAYNLDGTCRTKPEETKEEEIPENNKESEESGSEEEEDSDEDETDDDLSDLKQDESESSEDEANERDNKEKLITPNKNESKKRKLEESTEVSLKKSIKKDTVLDIKKTNEILISANPKTPQKNETSGKQGESGSLEDETNDSDTQEKIITPNKKENKKKKLKENTEVTKKELIKEDVIIDIKNPKENIINAIVKTAHKKNESVNTENEENVKNLDEKSQKTIVNEESKINQNDSGIINDKSNHKSLIEELLANEKAQDAAANELPYTFTLPENYEDLQSLLSNQSPEYQSIIIERMIKCNHPNLANGNKESLGRLFVYLLQHLNDVSQEPLKCFSVLNCLMPHLYDLAQLNKENAHGALIEVMKEKQNDYKKKPKKYPGMDVLLFLKLISCLFPTSDFRHQVVTPTFIFITQMLTTCRIKSKFDISYGLFLITMLLEYTILSKRLVPAAIIYLAGLIHMAIPKTGVQLIKVIPPFKSTCSDLVLTNKIKISDTDLRMKAEDFDKDEIDDLFKVRTMYNVIQIVDEFYENYSSLPSWAEILQPILNYMEKLPISYYPNEVRITIEKVMNNINNGLKNRKLEYLVWAAKKPKALRLYEPNIVKIVEGKNHRIMSKEKAESSKLLHKYKKEMKGALREIRRDKSFLGRVKLKQRIEGDRERKEKVKQIFSEASIQQGELNAMSRKKKTK